MNCANFVNPCIAKKQVWNVGDWAFHDSLGVIEIKEVETKISNAFRVKRVNGELWYSEPRFLRPLTPTDWVKEVDGVRYRAYEAEGNSVGIASNKATYFSDKTIAKSFCKLAEIPIMPKELHKCNYEYPE